MKARILPRASRRGVALFSAVLLVGMAMAASMLMTRMASTSNTAAETRRQRVRAQYLAEGAVNQVEAVLRERFLDSGSDDAAVHFLTGSGGDLADWFDDEGVVQLGEHTVAYTIEATGDAVEVTGADGLTAAVVVLEIGTQVDLPGVHARANGLLRARLVPINQFAVFYDMDMDLWPGKDMIITGPIHTNGTLYVGCGQTLQFDTNYVRAVGGLIQDRAWKNQEVGGGAQIQFRRWVSDPWDPSEPVEWVTLPRKQDLADDDIPSQSGLDSRFLGHDDNSDGDYDDEDELSPFAVEILELYSEPDVYVGGSGSTILTGEHGVVPVNPPGVGVTSMYVEAAGGDYVLDGGSGEYVPTAPGTGTHEAGLYHQEAGLSIIVSDDGTWSAFQDGFDVTASLGSVVAISDLADVREGYMVDTAEIDLAALEASGFFPNNGLLYLGAYGGVPLQETKGFVLTNGDELGGPLTTVTENSIYIEGDFNVTDKKPAAVIADTVNLLSNSWDGTKELSDDDDVHDASDTTYNLAIVSGNLESVWGTNLSGGMNNIVRLHEDWKDRDCTITGSFAALWAPIYTDAPLDGNAYNVPRRIWSFDRDFLDFDGLPPYAPCYLELHRVASW